MLAAVAVAASVAMLRKQRRAGETQLIVAASALDSRLIEGRIAESIAHRPLRIMRGSSKSPTINDLRDVALDLCARWESNPSVDNGRVAGAALLVAGEPERATEILTRILQRSTGETSTLDAIGRSNDAPLLIDYSAAALARAAGRTDAVDQLLAFEAADAALRLQVVPPAAWNRAVAAERIGLLQTAIRAWEEAAKEPGSEWSGEANRRRNATVRRHAEPVPQSPELFFHDEMIERAAITLRGAQAGAGADAVMETGPRVDLPRDDHLLTDTVASLGRMRTRNDRARALTALASFSRGLEAFRGGRPSEALPAFTAAERDLAGLQIPAVLLARDHRIRSQCWMASPSCLDEIRAFRAELLASGRYPWLAARLAYSEGQTYYRSGRIYEAAEMFAKAQEEFRRVNDSVSETNMHSLLANAFAAAGETDAALTHYLAAIRGRAPHVSDGRRKQLEDAMQFMLRHGYFATAEAILEELAAAPATDAARVMEATLRGVLAVRRDDVRGAATAFERARALIPRVEDETARSEVRRALVIAEAGSGTESARPALVDLDAAVAVDQQEEISIWLPQLLMQRGAVFEAAGDVDRAEKDYRRAIDLLEKREPRIDETMLSLGIAYDGETPFDCAIRLLLHQRRIAEALAIAQRAATLRISSLHAQSLGVADVFRNARGSAGADVVAGISRMLQPRQTAVAYHLLPDELVTWIVTSDKVIVVRRGVRAKDVIHLAEKLRMCAAQGGCDDREAIERVSELLLRDWIDHTLRNGTLLIQPPAELQAVPFPMLEPRAGEVLLERNAVATAPSLRAFLRAGMIDTEKSAQMTAFFAAAPRPGGDYEQLPEAQREVTLASRFHRGAVVDTATTRARFLERSPSFSIVHFAGHVLVNDAQPLQSALLFDRDDASSDSQLLYVHELNERTFANARLVVLAGCDTGRAPRPTMSVANALLSQRVPSVVYTLWPVADDAAETFAVAFHRAIAAGRTRAEAVRESSLALMRTHPRSPDVWAAFALAGAPGALNATTKGVAP